MCAIKKEDKNDKTERAEMHQTNHKGFKVKGNPMLTGGAMKSARRMSGKDLLEVHSGEAGFGKAVDAEKMRRMRKAKKRASKMGEKK